MAVFYSAEAASGNRAEDGSRVWSRFAGRIKQAAMEACWFCRDAFSCGWGNPLFPGHKKRHLPERVPFLEEQDKLPVA
jgi:hypothetical protein